MMRLKYEANLFIPELCQTKKKISTKEQNYCINKFNMNNTNMILKRRKKKMQNYTMC
ncbi:MAG: hypothetical protein WCS17_01350 [Prevotella sp.]